MAHSVVPPWKKTPAGVRVTQPGVRVTRVLIVIRLQVCNNNNLWIKLITGHLRGTTLSTFVWRSVLLLGVWVSVGVL